MGIVQRIPGGLLELLSAKTSGITPSDLATAVQPTIDLLQMFGLAQPLETINVQDAALVEGSAVAVAVPTTEWWMLYALANVYVRTTTQTAVKFSLRIGPSAGVLTVPVATGPTESVAPTTTAATDVVGAVFVPSYPMLLPPGTTLYAFLDVLGTDATMNVSLRARIARLT